VTAIPNQIDGGRMILVIHDVEETRDGVEALLHSDGYRVMPARCEEEAVRTATREQPDLVLLSLGESDENVTAISWRIRAGAGLGAAIPLIMFGSTSIADGAEVDGPVVTYSQTPLSFRNVYPKRYTFCALSGILIFGFLPRGIRLNDQYSCCPVALMKLNQSKANTRRFVSVQHGRRL